MDKKQTTTKNPTILVLCYFGLCFLYSSNHCEKNIKYILIISVAVEYFCIIGTCWLHFTVLWPFPEVHSNLNAIQNYLWLTFVQITKCSSWVFINNLLKDKDFNGDFLPSFSLCVILEKLTNVRNCTLNKLIWSLWHLEVLK